MTTPNSFVSIVERAEDSESSAQLLRTKSDAGVLRRGQRRSPSNQRKIRRHRFSINGHFYNHKVELTHLQKMPSFTFCPLVFVQQDKKTHMNTSSVKQMPDNTLLVCLPVPDSSFHTCLWLGHQCSDQQLHDHASGAASSPQQVQN